MKPKPNYKNKTIFITIPKKKPIARACGKPCGKPAEFS